MRAGTLDSNWTPGRCIIQSLLLNPLGRGQSQEPWTLTPGKLYYYFFFMDIYMFLNTSELKIPLIMIYSGNLKLKKTLFERHQNNTAIWVDYLILKEHNFCTVFHFKTSCMHFLADDQTPPPLADFSAKNAIFLTCNIRL